MTPDKLILAAFAAGLTGAAAEAQLIRDYPVDPLRIAVRLVDPAVEPELASVVQSAGAELAATEPFSGTDRLLRLPEARSAADLAQLADRIASDERVQFASVVRHWKQDLPVYALPTVYLRFEDDVPEAVQRATLSRLPGLRPVEREFAGLPNTWSLESSATTGAQVLAQVAALKGTPGARWVQADHALMIRTTDVTPDDCFWAQWMHQNGGFDIDFETPTAWCTTTGASNVYIAVLDSGVQSDHPDMEWFTGADFTNDFFPDGGRPVNQWDNHGTQVAGVALAKLNNLSYTSGGCPGLLVGVSPGCRVASARICIAVQTPAGACSTEFGWIANGINWSSGIADITVTSQDMLQSQLVDDAYAATRAGGTLHFSSTGNAGIPSVNYPANLPSVLAVGGISVDGERQDCCGGGSNYGPEVFCVGPYNVSTLDRTGTDGDAPSMNWTFEDHVGQSGTSFSAPTVAGVAALMKSVRFQLNADDLELLLQMSCQDLEAPGFDIEVGHGLPDASVAVDLAGDTWVDGGIGSSGIGTVTQPYKTVAEGVSGVITGERMVVEVGSYDEMLTISTPMTIDSSGGTAIIGE